MLGSDEIGNGFSPSQEELEEILQKHQSWLSTGDGVGTRGRLQRADLSGVEIKEKDLTKFNFWGADLSDATLTDVVLSEAILIQADLSGADLTWIEWDEDELMSVRRATGPNLSNAYLIGGDLQDATLTNADLSGAHLLTADLSAASLGRADLQGATLRKADLSNAYLRNANLSGADLTDAKLHGADLQDSDLSETTGLQVEAIGRSNVSNATLPDNVARFEGLRAVEDASRGARKLFIALGLACAYSALTVSTAPPGEFVPLPFVDVEVSLWSFFLVAPAILSLGFGYSICD